MTARVVLLTKRRRITRTAWATLASYCKWVSKLHLRQLVADDPKRVERLAVEAVGLYLDYSRNRVTDATLRLLFTWRKSPACGHESMPCSTGKT
jgi:hypothetical protein